MARLIDDLLSLPRVSRSELYMAPTDLVQIASDVLSTLRRAELDRTVEFVAPPSIMANGDDRLLGIVLENLLSNAWKFTRKSTQVRIELGREMQAAGAVFFI